MQTNESKMFLPIRSSEDPGVPALLRVGATPSVLPLHQIAGQRLERLGRFAERFQLRER